ncbi:uncharacterized protein LOC122038170 isoform X2 [Zingiber officinale]|uniref:uncharacterized protein LOC122038170 isoform X2 n=1 Tax=Zingiber officinale TaxID=94328 RepID=UPI001C4BB666|nr:uncharacterized protein LOC122038170 isoform X2 [Zingiber officinale]
MIDGIEGRVEVTESATGGWLRVLFSISIGKIVFIYVFVTALFITQIKVSIVCEFQKLGLKTKVYTGQPGQTYLPLQEPGTEKK